MKSQKEVNKYLKNYSNYVGGITLDIYDQINELLIELIGDDKKTLAEAQRLLNSKYNDAVESTLFKPKFTVATKGVVAKCAYDEALGGTLSQFADYIYNKSMFDDKIKLSTRIRNNSNAIVSEHKLILRNALKEGRQISSIVGNINDDLLKDFTRSLPKYLDDLRGKYIAGEKLTEAYVLGIKKHIEKISSKGLKANYLDILKNIELDKKIDKAVYFAMERKTKYYAERLSRTEAIRTMAVEETHRKLQDPDINLVMNKTQGSNPCTFCVAMHNMGFVPVISATLATHHPHCSCRPIFHKTIVKQEKISQEDFEAMFQNQYNGLIDSGGKKTYIYPPKPYNLRDTDPMKDWKPR